MDCHRGSPRAERRTLVVLSSILGISVLFALALFGVSKVRTNRFLKGLAALGLASLALGNILLVVVNDSKMSFNPYSDGTYNSLTRTYTIDASSLNSTWSFFDPEVITYAFYVGAGLLGLAMTILIAIRVWPAITWFFQRYVVRGFIALAAQLGRRQVVVEAKAHQKVGSDVDLNAVRVAARQAGVGQNDSTAPGAKS